jgi:protease stability complex PrcB-like protein
MIGAVELLPALLLQAMLPPTRSLDRGTLSEVSTPRQVAVRDEGAWEMLWRVHAPTRPSPPVDFASEIVVGVFAGTRPSAGFGVEIVGYHLNGDDVVVQYRESSPPRGAITAQVLTTPYHLVVIPKRTGNVTFEKLQN